MTAGEITRKLTAVIHADVKGYSRLMAADEVSTVQTLSAYKTVLSKLVPLRRGRVVDTAGDGFLLEFASAVDAVSFAVEFQREIKGRNSALPDSRKMEFRLGVNIGDVIQEGDLIFGDGVNIAARLENLDDPGGICVSGTVYDHVKKKLPLNYEYLGERDLKNIGEPVRVYRLLMEPEAFATAETSDRKVESRWWRTALVGAVAVVLMAAGAVGVLYLANVKPPEEPRPKEKPAEVIRAEQRYMGTMQRAKEKPERERKHVETAPAKKPSETSGKESRPGEERGAKRSSCICCITRDWKGRVIGPWEKPSVWTGISREITGSASECRALGGAPCGGDCDE